MKLLNELRFLSVSTLIFMLISIIAVSYLFFYQDVDHHLGNKPTVGVENADSMPEQITFTDRENNGKTLFKMNCGRCHKVTDERSIGPGLKDVMQRIDEDQLISWVQDPAKTRRNDDYFRKLTDDYGTEMQSFQLTRDEILSIIEYVQKVQNGEPNVVVMK